MSDVRIFRFQFGKVKTLLTQKIEGWSNGCKESNSLNMNGKPDRIILRFKLSTLQPIPPIYHALPGNIYHNNERREQNIKISSSEEDKVDKGRQIRAQHDLDVENKFNPENRVQRIRKGISENHHPSSFSLPSDLTKPKGRYSPNNGDSNAQLLENRRRSLDTPSNHDNLTHRKSEDYKKYDNQQNYLNDFRNDSTKRIKLNNTSESREKNSVLQSQHNEKNRSSTDMYHSSNSILSPSLLLGKRVRIITGKLYGLEGTVTDVGTRGWLSIDNPALVGRKVQSRQCELVNDNENNDMNAMFETDSHDDTLRQSVHLEGNGTNHHSNDKNNSLLHRRDHRPKSEQNSDGKKNQFQEKQYHEYTDHVTDHIRMNNKGQNQADRPRRATKDNVYYNYDSDSNINSLNTPLGTGKDNDWQKNNKQSHPTFLKRNRLTLGNSSFEQSRKTNSLSSPDGYLGKNAQRNFESNHRTSSNPLSIEKKLDIPSTSKRKRPNSSNDNFMIKPPQHSRYSLKKHMSQPLLPPVRLNDEDDSVLPESLQHLPGDFKIEIFNRKTGRVLSGEDAVSIHLLPSVLRKHAEYEPIVPPPKMLEKFCIGKNK